MRRTLAISVLTLVCLARAGAQPPPTVTLEGTLIDLLCYAQKMVNQPDLDCTKFRSPKHPVGLMENAGQRSVHTIASTPYVLSRHLAKTVRITGELLAPHLVKPTKLEVRTEEGWKELELLPEM